MRVAVAQIDCRVGDVAGNLGRIRAWCERARAVRADLIVFPEMVDTGYSMAAIGEHASPRESGPVPALRSLARERSLAIIAGLAERDGASIYNAQLFIDKAGHVLARYRKIHLFTPPPVAEHTCFAPGDALVAAEHKGLRFGLSICYDLRFPELYRALAIGHGVTVFATSSAWPFPRVGHLRCLATARAIENQSYLILANRIGCDDGLTFCGASAVIDPYGVTLCAGSEDREELLFADITPEVVKKVRDRMPVLEHRREDVYRR